MLSLCPISLGWAGTSIFVTHSLTWYNRVYVRNEIVFPPPLIKIRKVLLMSVNEKED